MLPKGGTSPATTPEATCEYRTDGWRADAHAPLSPVYEYPLNGQWIMLDMDDGYVLWTGIWKGAPPPVWALRQSH